MQWDNHILLTTLLGGNIQWDTLRVEIDDLKILCDVSIQWVHLIQARRLNMIVVNKGERKYNIIDVIVPDDSRVMVKSGSCTCDCGCTLKHHREIG